MRASVGLSWTSAAVALSASCLSCYAPAAADMSQWQEDSQQQRQDQYQYQYQYQYQDYDDGADDETTEEDVYFTFELSAENICNDAADGGMMPDTKASIEEGCLNWVQDLTELSREELEMRNAKRGEDGDDDFLSLFLIKDLNVSVMVLSAFVDGTSCDADADSSGSYGYRRSLQESKLSRGSIAAKGNCRRCKQQKTKDRALRRRLSTGNLTAALVDVGFKDAKNVGFANFRIKDCANSAGPDCTGPSGEYACCGFEGCACEQVSETLCFEEECSGVDGLCCEPNMFSGARYLYPQCASTCDSGDGGNNSSSIKNMTTVASF